MRPLIITLLSFGVLAGCASSDSNDSVIPSSDMTVVEVYDEFVSKDSTSAAARQALVRVADHGGVEFDPYLQTNNAKPKYRKLDNPTLYIYFPPSINEQEGIPTPGWMTEIQMYATDQYALPGEVGLGGAQ